MVRSFLLGCVPVVRRGSTEKGEVPLIRRRWRLMLTSRAAGYWRERPGRSLTQARTPMTTSSSHGENRTCTAKPRTVRATMAMRTRARIASMVIGLRWCRSGCADVLRLPSPSARVDRDQPRSGPEMHPASIRVNPGSRGFQNPGRVRALVSVDALARLVLRTAHTDHADA